MTHTVTQDITADAEVFIGETKNIDFTVKDSADAIINITGWTFTFEVRLTPYTPTAVLSKTNLVPTDAPGGKVRVALTGADTAGLRAGTYYYGIARTNVGAYDVVAQGVFVLRKAAVHV